MDYKWIGAVLIVAGCGGFGFSLVAAHRREERTLQSVLRILDHMISELHFHSTPLPELCMGASALCHDAVGELFMRLSAELEACDTADASECMKRVLDRTQIPQTTCSVLEFLGASMGRYDMDGQMKTLEESRKICRSHLHSLSENREGRLRNYQTLSLCTGAALAILLI